MMEFNSGQCGFGCVKFFKVIFIDDGIASGKSAVACIKLIEGHNAQPAQVPLVLSLLKYDYTTVDPKLSEHRLVKTLFDCKKEGGNSPRHEPDQMILKNAAGS
jgi:orotate phosphoribosyltransferase